MKKVLLLTTAALIACTIAQSQITVKTVDTADLDFGYAAFSELPANGGAGVFAQPWGVADLTGEALSATDAKMGAVQVNDGASFWIVGGDGTVPAAGSDYEPNKWAETTWYGEVDASTLDATFQFNVNVTAFDLAAPYSVSLVIKQSANGYSPVLTPITGTGILSVQEAVNPAGGNMLQWGLLMTGPNVVPGDQYRFGSVTISAVPEPSTFALIGGFLALGFVLYRRRKQAQA